MQGADEKRLKEWEPRMKKLIQSKGEHLAIVEEEDFAYEIIRTTLENGGKLLSLTPRRQTLEEYFVSEVAGNDS